MQRWLLAFKQNFAADGDMMDHFNGLQTIVFQQNVEVAVIDNSLDVVELHRDTMLYILHHLIDVCLRILVKQSLNFLI